MNKVWMAPNDDLRRKENRRAHFFNLTTRNCLGFRCFPDFLFQHWAFQDYTVSDSPDPGFASNFVFIKIRFFSNVFLSDQVFASDFSSWSEFSFSIRNSHLTLKLMNLINGTPDSNLRDGINDRIFDGQHTLTLFIEAWLFWWIQLLWEYFIQKHYTCKKWMIEKKKPPRIETKTSNIEKKPPEKFKKWTIIASN